MGNDVQDFSGYVCNNNISCILFLIIFSMQKIALRIAKMAL